MNHRECAPRCCIVLAAFGIGPRTGLLVWWLFGDRVEQAFDSWFWPLLGLVFAPWTTLFYLFMWSANGGVSGAEWIFVGLGVALDVLSYLSRQAKWLYDRRYA
jgi:hypothetical protein